MSSSTYQPCAAPPSPSGGTPLTPARSKGVAILLSVGGVIAGIVVGGIVVGIVEIPGYFIHPPPPNFDINDPQAVEEHMAAAPTSVMLLVLLAWTLGPLIGSFVAASIAQRRFVVHGMTIGLLFALLDLMNLVRYPHPPWLWAGGIIAPLAMGYVGALFAQRLFGPPSGPLPRDLRQKNMAC
jgi:hypothetical protein